MRSLLSRLDDTADTDPLAAAHRHGRPSAEAARPDGDVALRASSIQVDAPGRGREVHDECSRRKDAEDAVIDDARRDGRSEEHTSELQSLIRHSYAVFCLKKKQHISCNYNVITLSGI